jgi:hypothetical protein
MGSAERALVSVHQHRLGFDRRHLAKAVRRIAGF